MLKQFQLMQIIEIKTNGIATICRSFTYPEPAMLNQSTDFITISEVGPYVKCNIKPKTIPSPKPVNTRLENETCFLFIIMSKPMSNTKTTTLRTIKNVFKIIPPN